MQQLPEQLLHFDRHTHSLSLTLFPVDTPSLPLSTSAFFLFFLSAITLCLLTKQGQMTSADDPEPLYPVLSEHQVFCLHPPHRHMHGPQTYIPSSYGEQAAVQPSDFGLSRLFPSLKVQFPPLLFDSFTDFSSDVLPVHHSICDVVLLSSRPLPLSTALLSPLAPLSVQTVLPPFTLPRHASLTYSLWVQRWLHIYLPQFSHV